MSTFISDLPGAQDEILHEEEEQSEQQQYPQQHQQQNEQLPSHFEEPIKLSFKKKDKKDVKINQRENFWQENSLFDQIKMELNEENTLIFILIFIATLSQSNEYVRKGLVSVGGSGFSHMSVTLIKCAALVLLFILIKKYFLKV